jgi:hypothetical protein
VNAEGSPFVAALVEAQAAQLDAETERDLADQAAQELREALAVALEKLEALQAERESRTNGLSHEALAAELAAQLEARWGTPPASWRERIGSRR